MKQDERLSLIKTVSRNWGRVSCIDFDQLKVLVNPPRLPYRICRISLSAMITYLLRNSVGHVK